MKTLRVLVHFLLLITTPPFLVAAPQNCVLQVDYADKFFLGNFYLKYDDVMDLIADIESGDIEYKCPPEDIEKIIHFVVSMTRLGLLPGEDAEELERDNQALLRGDDDYEFFRNTDNEYVFVPALFSGKRNVVLCKNWFGKRADIVGRYIKKHKKTFIIATALGLGVVAAVGIAAAVSAGAAASVAAAASSSNSSHTGKGEESKLIPEEESLTIPPANESSLLTTTIDEQVFSFKEVMLEEKIAEQISPFKGRNDPSFGEKTREYGSHLAHKVFDEVTDLVKMAPQLCEEIKEIGSRLVPEHFSLPDYGASNSPLENYESLVAQGHQVIDRAFSTDQSERFSTHSKEQGFAGNFAVGMLPLPGGIPKFFENTSKLIEAGAALDRAGFTKAGRSFMKHGYRDGSVFSKPTGTPTQINEHGLKVLESIVNHPERKISYKHTKHLGEIIDIYAPEIGGARYTISGELIGFLEP